MCKKTRITLDLTGFLCYNNWAFEKMNLAERHRCIIKYRSGCGAVGSALPWGGRGRTFKSCHSDQKAFEFSAKCTDSRAFSYQKRLFFVVFAQWIDFGFRACYRRLVFSTNFLRIYFRIFYEPTPKHAWKPVLRDLVAAKKLYFFLRRCGVFCSLYGN